jgi:hypothetical protein
MDELVQKAYEEISQHFLSKHGSTIDAIIAYGSKINNTATYDSHYDCLVIVDDYKKFHSTNKEGYKGYRLWFMRKPNTHVFLNELGPNFYQETIDDKEVKYGVIGLKDFRRACKSGIRIYVKGRLQKPLRIIYADDNVLPEIRNGILRARIGGVNLALKLLPKRFSMYDLIKEIVGMSYKADIRLESPTKVEDIVKKNWQELIEIYKPLVESRHYIYQLNGEYENRKYRMYNKKRVLGYLRRRAWVSALLNIKNGLTNKKAVAYAKRKWRMSLEKK